MVASILSRYWCFQTNTAKISFSKFMNQTRQALEMKMENAGSSNSSVMRPVMQPQVGSQVSKCYTDHFCNSHFCTDTSFTEHGSYFSWYDSIIFSFFPSHL